MNAEEVLGKLLKDGVLTHQQVANTIDKDPQLRELADMLHSTICKGDHDRECLWYSEENFDRTWERDGHIYWKQRALLECDNLDAEPTEVMHGIKLAADALCVRNDEHRPAVLRAFTLFLRVFLAQDDPLPAQDDPAHPQPDP